MYPFGVSTEASLHVVGISHHTAGVALREQFSLSPAEVTAWLERARDSGRTALLLSTCNRCELYWYGDGDHEASFREFARVRGIGDEVALERWEGLGAVHHIFTVAAGLDSQVLGETEILGQVRRAYDLARAAGTTAHDMDLVFSAALSAGRRVRRETMLGRHPSSVSAAAVEIMAECWAGGDWPMRASSCSEPARRRRECSRRFTRGVPRAWTWSTGTWPGLARSPRRGMLRLGNGTSSRSLQPKPISWLSRVILATRALGAGARGGDGATGGPSPGRDRSVGASKRGARGPRRSPASGSSTSTTFSDSAAPRRKRRRRRWRRRSGSSPKRSVVSSRASAGVPPRPSSRSCIASAWRWPRRKRRGPSTSLPNCRNASARL